MPTPCERCRKDIPEGDSFSHLGLKLCEDCYMDAMEPNRTCDPWAVYSATNTREQSGASGADGLTSLQQAMYQFIKNRGEVTAEEIITKFSLSPRDFQNQFTVLRHCELVHGRKEGDRVFIMPFS